MRITNVAFQTGVLVSNAKKNVRIVAKRANKNILNGTYAAINLYGLGLDKAKELGTTVTTTAFACVKEIKNGYVLTEKYNAIVDKQ